MQIITETSIAIDDLWIKSRIHPSSEDDINVSEMYLHIKVLI